MSLTITAIGNVRDEIKNNSTQQIIYADGGKNIGGLEENFSPTDYVALAVASCAMIGMEVFATKRGYDFKNCYTKADKETDMKNYQLSKIKLEIHLKKSFPEDFRKEIESVHERACIVERSLKDEIEKDITFIYDVE